MGQKKYGGRDPIITICRCLVETHEDRKKSIELAKTERDMLELKRRELKISGNQKSGGQRFSDPVYELQVRKDELDEYIADNQRIVEIVDRAIDRIGHYEKNQKIRQQMRDGILANIQMGGHVMPFEYVNYPDKYGKKSFYAQRRAFLLEIARELHLNLKT